MRHVTVICAILATLLSAPLPPVHGHAAWVTSSTGRLSWVQQSNANTACLSSISGSGDFFNSIEVCVPSAPGANAFDLVRTTFPYGTYFPVAGDVYYITEWYIDGPAQQYYGIYGPFPLESVTYLPILMR
jgi:hypothetical protein